MFLRIETTNITSGREFSLYAYSVAVPSVEIYAFNPVSREIEPLDYEHILDGVLHRFDAVAPTLNGFMLTKVNAQRFIKRIGNPLTTFIVGYKANYTIPYKAISKDGTVLYQGDLTPIMNGFYYAPIHSGVVMMEVFNKKILINQNILKMNYEIIMDGGELNSSFDNVAMDNIALPDIELPIVELGDTVLESTLPDITIEEI